MADMNSTATTTRRAAGKPRSKAASGPAVKPQHKVSEVLPAYGTGNGVLSFVHGLRARERGTVAKALDIIGRTLREPGRAFANPAALKQYLVLALAGERHECFAVLYLDCKSRAIAFETHFIGTLTQTSVYPREIALAALRHNAANVVLSHNHPSGSVWPSDADHSLTRCLKCALALVDVRVMDHIIVSGKDTLSLAEQGLL